MRADRENIRDMRRAGLSYNEIAAKTGARKSTIHYIVLDIVLSDEQRQRLRQNSVAGAARGRASISPATRREISSIGGKSLWKNNPVQARENLSRAVTAAALAYLDDELIVLSRLTKLYGESFHKARVAGYYFDFVSETRLIEHTRDGKGKGLRAIINRFTAAHNDPREKHAYVDTKYVGPSRRLELSVLGVTLHSLQELELVSL